AIMGQRVIHVMTHDSIGVGEDGPTHEPIEHLAALRAVPNLMVFRPCDAVETVECWQLALEARGPSVMALTRQNLPQLRRDLWNDNRCRNGAYELVSAEDGRATVSLFASGSEVAIAVEARDLLIKRGCSTRVVSVPCFELLLAAPSHVRQSIVGEATLRIAVEAAVRQGWDAIIGSDGLFVGMSGFGASAPHKDLYRHFAINDLASVETNAHLLRFDSIHGRFPGQVKVDGDSIDCGTGKIKVTATKDPKQLPWKDLGIDIVLECTGIFTSKEKASVHLEAGAKRVLISAPSDGADLTVVYGVNHDKLTKQHLVVSNASCTTNCLAPVPKVLHDAVGIEKGFMTTVHAYTNDQPSLDQVHKDLYRARAAALSMIPTSTGAAKAVGLVLPELAGKLDGVAIRVPVANVSAIDFKFVAKRPTSKDEINGAVTRAAAQQ